MKTFLRLFAFAKPYSRYWPKYIIITLLSLLFGIVNFTLIIPLLDVLFNPESMEKVTALPAFTPNLSYLKEVFNYYLYDIIQARGVLSALLFVCILLIAASVAANYFKYAAQRVLVGLRTTVMQKVRTALYNKITRLHVGYFTNNRKGDILSSISNDVTEVQNSVAGSFHIIFRDPLLLIGYLVVLFIMSAQLTSIALIALPLSAFVITRITKRLRRQAVNAQKLMANIVGYFEETISGARIIKAFNAQHYVRKQFETTNAQHRAVTKRMFNRQELASPLSETLGITVTAFILLYGGWLQVNGKLGMGISEFVAYLAFYYQVLSPAKAIAGTYALIQKGLISGERIFAIIDAPVEITKRNRSIPVCTFTDKITYRDVSFAYQNEPVLNHINLTIEKGQMVALVGLSGAGKTTMADLLPRFYDVTSGEILLDNINIKDYEPKGLIGLMGIVTQDAILFNDTVFNNIAFGVEDVAEAAVVRAAKIANAHEFIMQMEHGYQTGIGDQGNRLSGGQRQRLSIARAILKNPPILILDEATSALDTESERLVQDALMKLMENRTSIVIAHRLSTVQHADKIVVMDKGCIVETGTHAELLAKQGIYKRLCDLQEL
ncbi:MAG: ABC transporter ATP-binding protein/permease [Prevotellaceae bacterium]|nr:ABC transporter ATP-binding protein/permease [Prevotellaceae bacterium]